MESVGTLALIVGAFVLIHVLIYWYLYRRSGGLDAGGVGAFEESASTNRGFDRPPEPPERADPAVDDADADETVLCPHCGTRNEAHQTITFCRNCVERLGG